MGDLQQSKAAVVAWQGWARLLFGMFWNNSSQLVTEKWVESLRKTSTRWVGP